MESAQIVMSGPRASMYVGNRVISTVSVGDADRLIITYRRDPLYQGEEPFFVVSFPDVVWVVPYFAKGIQTFLETTARAAQGHAGVFRAVAERLPWSWRRRALGFLPVFSEVALATHPLNSIPRWHLEGPINPATAHEIAAS
jgi:hypothetical protein